MSKYLISPEISDPELTGIDIAVWHGLSSFAQWEFVNGAPVKSKVNTCFPSLPTLSEKIRFSVRAISRSLKNLEKLGYIKKLKKHKKKSTNYMLICKNELSMTFNCYDQQNNINYCQSGHIYSNDHSPTGSDYGLTVQSIWTHSPTNNINNNINNINQEKEQKKGDLIQKNIAKNEYNMRSRTPIKDAKYDERAFQVITDMYYLCLDYMPDVPAEIRLLQDLREEYPNVNLFREFRKARDWLEGVNDEARPVNLLKFLRKWTANANTQNVIQAHRGRY